MSQPRSWIAAVVVAAAMTPSPARADSKNEIRAVTFDDDAGTTRVHVRGAQTPTFTVYKLERPSRVVIDVPQAHLAESLRGHDGAPVLAANTWAVSTIAAQELDDGGLVVRVIVTLARPGRYDVKTSGNELVVMVMPRDPAPRTASPEALATAQAEREQAKQAAQAAQAEREQAKQAAQAAEQGRALAEQSIAAAQAEAAKAKNTATVAQAEAAKAKNTATVAQAEAAKAKNTAAAAQAEAAQAKDTAAAAQAEAERLRKTAAEQAARAMAAQQAADETLRAGVQSSAADLARAKATAAAAQAEAAKLKAEAARAQSEADRTRAAAERATRDAMSEADRARAQAAAAQADAARTRQEAAREVEAAARTKTEAEAAKQAASRDVEAAKQAAAREAEVAKQDVARSKAEAEAAKAEAARMRTEAEAARADAETAKAQAAADKQAAEAARGDAEKLLRDAKQEVTALDKKAQAAQALEDKARAANAAAQAREEAAHAVAARAATERATAEAAAQAAAEARDRLTHQAGADRDKAIAEARTAEARLALARRATDDAEQQRAAAEAAAVAAKRELEHTRTALSSVEQQRTAAEVAASQAAHKRGEAEAAASDAARRRSEAETAAATAAKQRTAAEVAANQATQRRGEAETAAATAVKQRAAAEVAANQAAQRRGEAEQQRTAAEVAANQAAQRRGEAEQQRTAAEVAASQAAQRRGEAEAQRTAVEVAAKQAAQRRGEAEAQRAAAEQQRTAAEAAARTAKAAADAADNQRKIAEAAAKAALGAKHDAEASLAELSARRLAAERAAAELEARSKAEARAQAEVVAAKTRKASDDELAQARAEASRLAGERKHAEAELAERRKAAFAQNAEADRLRLAAAQAHDAADREEARRARLAEQRAAEEQALARIKAQKAAALFAAPPPAVVTAAQPAGKPAKPTPLAQVRDIGFTGDDVTGQPAGKPAKPTPLAQVRDIGFTGDDVTGHVTISLAGDATVTVGAVTQTAAELIIDHAKLAGKLERRLDVHRFGGPVRAVSSFRDRRTPDRVRVIAELSSPATPSFDRETGTIRWNFVGADIAKRPVTARPGITRTQNVPSPIVGGFGAASTPVAQQSISQLPPQGNRRRVYHGQTVELHFKDAPIHDLLRTIADVGKVSIVVPDTIDAKVTLDLKRVPWDQALEVILSSHQLWYRREGNLYRIAPRKELDAEDEAEAARREAALKAESPRPQLVPLNYSSAADLAKKLEPMLSPHGKIAVDERTNQLIVTDVAGNREQIARLALSLDTQTPQISIEARVVEANSTFLRQIGVQWGGRALAGATGGNATGLVWPSSISLIGGNEDAQTVRSGVAAPSDFAVNLPAATGSGEGGALGLSLGSVGGNFNINLRLSALEDAGTVRIISAPKVTVLNNKQASIASGVSIPISTISATGTQTQFVQADLRLDVTPAVSQSDCAITMTLVIQKNEPDFVNVGARGDPTILRKEAHTVMLVADGETSVLGGIYTRNSGLAYKKIPFLGDLPVLGWLFKTRRENDDRTEILVFITPKITNRALLRCK